MLNTPERPVLRLLSPATLWSVVMILSALYIASEAARYFWLPPERYPFPLQRETYQGHGLVMLTHIGAGIVALLVGALQFAPGLKHRRRLHRATGSVYCAAVAVGGLAGLKASGFAFGGVSNTVAFGLMSSVWLLTTAMALWSIACGQVSAHQRWMKRSYAITLAAVTLRIELGLLIFLGGLSFRETYLIVPWTSWVLNLLIVEWWPAVTRFSLPASVGGRAVAGEYE